MTDQERLAGSAADVELASVRRWLESADSIEGLRARADLIRRNVAMREAAVRLRLDPVLFPELAPV